MKVSSHNDKVLNMPRRPMPQSFSSFVFILFSSLQVNIANSLLTIQYNCLPPRPNKASLMLIYASS